MTTSVTISASFGARGDQIGHAVAKRLDLAFLDRAIPGAVARQLHLSDASVQAYDERAPSRWTRFAAAFAGFDLLGTPAPELAENVESLRSATESVLREVADSTGGVILGRAGMVVLANRPDVLRVRLDGPLEARMAQAITDGADAGAVGQTQKDVDGARESYAQFFYGVHQGDSGLYHLVIDSTAMSVATCVEIIYRAAKDRFAEPAT